MKSPIVRVTKITAAERQLKEAIRLFFQERDPVAIHTLIGAAYQIFYDLGRKQGNESLLRDSEWIRDERKKEWNRILNSARNFFKHADRDPENELEFRPEINPFLLFDAILLCESVSKKRTNEGRIFVSWFTLKYPDLFIDNAQIRHARHILATGFDPNDFETIRLALNKMESG
jgi:hypothetical protein